MSPLRHPPARTKRSAAGEIAQQRQQQRHGMVGNGRGVGAGAVRDGDAVIARGLKVNTFMAHSPARR